MPSPSHSPFGDVLLCPVCMVLYEGRILQCSQGHAVCEACQLKLAECPHCRGVYVGTRNYVLEAVIAKLKRLRDTDNINLGDENDETPDDIKSSNEAPLSDVTQSDASESTSSVKILAPKGLYDCRMDNCDAKLPFCRLLNHLRYFHKDSLTVTTRTTNSNEDGDFVDHWSLPCVTFQKCFHLHNLGIFFLIFNVTQPDAPDGIRNIKAWVQCAYPNRTARNFRFSLELLMGNRVITFTDYVVGAQSDSEYIQSNNNCLNVDSAEHYDKVTIEMKISKTLGPQNLPRNDRTDCRLLPVSPDPFQQFCNTVTSGSPGSRLFKSLSNTSTNPLGSLKLPSGNFTETPEATLQHLLEVHFPGSTVTDTRLNLDALFRNPSTDEENLVIAKDIVSKEKISWAISTFSPYKSAGEDEVFPALLQNSTDLIITSLYELFTASIRFQHIPKCWRGVRVVFIPKLGQVSYHLAKAFRPISLTSFLLKTLEKLIDRYLRDGIFKEYKIHNNQVAYQPRKSTEAALHQLVHRIEKALDQNEYALGCFIDIDGAFNNMIFKAIRKACLAHGFNYTVTTWIMKMLKYRLVTSYLGSSKVSVFVSKGCPQGGILPPLLYCLVKDSLLTLLNDSGFYSQSFADDLAILLIGICISTLSNLMQSALNLIESWCQSNEQTANPGKTKLILFTRKRKIVGFKKPIFFGIRIELSDYVKFLGVILDSKLYWIIHSNHVIQRAIASLWQCRRLFGNDWGLRPKVLHWIYTSIIRPRLCYAAIVWWPRCELKTVQERLGKLQRLALIGITSAMKTTPSAALDALLNIEPLHIHIESVARSSLLRLKQASLLMKYPNFGHSRLWKTMTRQSPELDMPCDMIIPAYRFEKSFSVNIPEREYWSRPDSIPDNSLSWFTDGSRCNNLAGSGIFCPTIGKEISIPLGEHITVFITEINGILECCRVLLDHHKTNSLPIYIYTDSQGAIKAINNYKFSSSIVLECRDSLQKLAETTQVTLTWVPGHSNIAGNEKADELAREALCHQFTGPEPAMAVSFTTLQRIILTWKAQKFKNHWNSLEIARQARNSIKINNKNAKYLLSLNRSNLRKLTGILTGHSPLKKHLHTIGVINDPHCNMCGDIESTEHFLCQCPAYIKSRALHLGSFTLNYNSIWSLAPSSILKFMNETKRF